VNKNIWNFSKIFGLSINLRNVRKERHFAATVSISEEQFWINIF